jgi:hypothetical protein
VVQSPLHNKFLGAMLPIYGFHLPRFFFFIIFGEKLHKKHAIPNHFEEMAAWSQILQIVGNSTLIYLSFDTHDSPGAVFVLKWEMFSPNVPVCASSEYGVYINCSECQNKNEKTICEHNMF